MPAPTVSDAPMRWASSSEPRSVLESAAANTATRMPSPFDSDVPIEERIEARHPLRPSARG
jgi:hypothetical protein